MKRIFAGVALVAAAAALAFTCGRALAPREALAQQFERRDENERRMRLPVPHDVVVHMQKEAQTWAITASGVNSFDMDTVGGLTFLRLTVPSGKLWYIPLEHVTYIEAVPIVAPPPAAAPPAGGGGGGQPPR